MEKMVQNSVQLFLKNTERECVSQTQGVEIVGWGLTTRGGPWSHALIYPATRPGPQRKIEKILKFFDYFPEKIKLYIFSLRVLAALGIHVFAWFFLVDNSIACPHFPFPQVKGKGPGKGLLQREDRRALGSFGRVQLRPRIAKFNLAPFLYRCSPIPGRTIGSLIIFFGMLGILLGVTGPVWSQATGEPCSGGIPAFCFTVNSLIEGSDGDPGDGLCATHATPVVCTLRAAIEEANAHANWTVDGSPDGFELPDFIIFQVGGGFPVINLTSPLPPITDKLNIGSDTGPASKIVINGAGAGPGAVGIAVHQELCLINKLVLQGFHTAIVLSGEGNNKVLFSMIGTNPDGTGAVPNVRGIWVDSPNNEIRSNIISGNSELGILLEGTGAKGNKILGNSIGTQNNGTGSLGNGQHGIKFLNAPENQIGGLQSFEKNVISANAKSGILIEGINSNDNKILGNLIGTDKNGLSGLGNAENGIHLVDSPSQVIGGTESNAGNIVSGNGKNGVLIEGSGSSSTKILGNFIGTNGTGEAPIPNQEQGIKISRAGLISIGGAEPGSRNLISGNGKNGIFIQGSNASNHSVQGNLIGTNLAGTQALANGENGIHLRKILEDPSGPTVNLIGGGSEAERNVVSGNQKNGICLEGKGTANNRIEGNFVGTDITGTVAVEIG